MTQTNKPFKLLTYPFVEKKCKGSKTTDNYAGQY